jgi:hypothetical protein
MKLIGPRKRGTHARTPDDVGLEVAHHADGEDLAVVYTPDDLQIVEAPDEAPEQPARPAIRRRLVAFFDPRTARARFHRFRRSRPFWASVWVLLGGAIITYWPSTAFRFVFASTSVMEGMGVGVLIVVLGLFLLYLPTHRKLYSVLIVIAGVASLITSDIGGFVLGMMFTLVGGAMGFAWIPVAPPRRRRWWRRKADEARAVASA